MTTTPQLDRLASDLVVAAARVVRAVRHTVAQPTGVRVLSLLDERGALSITQLAEADHCSQPTMTGQVNALLEKGWVTKLPDPTDARRSLVRLTDDGRATLRDFRDQVGHALGDRIRRHGRHTPEDLIIAIAVLSDVLDNESTLPQKGIL